MPVTGTPISTTATIESWRIDTLPYLHSCHEAIVDQALRRGLREFCRDTDVWREQLSFTTVADQTVYDLNAEIGVSYDARVRRVLKVKVGDFEFDQTLYEVQDDLDLEFESSLTADLTMLVDVSLVPTEQWNTVSTELITDWADAPKAWALMHLKAMPRTPWSDEAWQYWQQEYRGHVARAKADWLEGHELGNASVTIRPFV